MHYKRIKYIYWFCLLLLFLVACKNIGRQKTKKEDLIDLTAATDSAELFAADIISTRLNDRDMAISDDGNEIYYSVTFPDNSLMAIVGLKIVKEHWIGPEVVSFSGVYNDIEPFLSPGGDKLFFSSNRPINASDTLEDFDIWFVERVNGEWTNPVNAGRPVNSLRNEFYPAVCTNGNLYFTGSIAGTKGAEDIFLSEFKDEVYQVPVSLETTINSELYEFNAYVSPDEQLIIFSSYGRPDGFGGGDLYFSHKDGSGNWTVARNLGPLINSDKLDYCPFPDFKRGIFYFTSNRNNKMPLSGRTLAEIHNLANQVLNGQGNIFRINLAMLALDTGK
jgi:hypothetical protein